jgi:two-component system sensor histidine kinase KdpD
VAANWYFAPPIHTLTISDLSNVMSLLVFLVVGSVIAALVTAAARRRTQAVQARAEAAVLARAAADVIDDEPLPAMLHHLCVTFGLHSASVLSPCDAPERWTAEAIAGDGSPPRPEDGDLTIPLADGAVLTLAGGPLGSEDRQVLETFCLQLRGARERQRLRREVANAEAVAQADALRTSLLRAVSHDLRSPLASIKASVTSLLQRDVRWSADDVSAFLATIDEETDRLDHLVGDLLDMSRLQAGAVHPRREKIALEDVVSAAVASLSRPPACLHLRLPTAAMAWADRLLLERALANVIANAAIHASSTEPVIIEAAMLGAEAHLRVVDRGPGVPPGDREWLFEPFQRLDDRRPGIGLGLAVARGFLSIMGGDLLLDDTPGGGLTVDLVLEAAQTPPVVDCSVVS